MTVVKLDLKNKQTRKQILDLHKAAYAAYSEDILAHTIDHPPQVTRAFGIFSDGNLVSVTLFIAHAIQSNGAVGIAYQACGVATRNGYGGRGYFSAIIDHAKSVLTQEDNAILIFGFPNSVAEPIWVKRGGFSINNNVSVLGFKVGPTLIGGLSPRQLSYSLADGNRTFFDLHETFEWKKKKSEELFEFENLTNYLFGKIETRKIFRKEIKIFIIGGIEINKPHQINKLLFQSLRKTRTSAFRIVVNSSSAIAKSSNIVRRSTLTEPLISFGLKQPIDVESIEIFGGLKDVF